jgi:uncharacterized membrane protein
MIFKEIKKDSRPRLTVPLSTSDKIVEGLSWLILLGMWAYCFIVYNRAPESVPSHFNGSGMADDYSDKLILFVMPVIATVLFVGMTILNKYPHLFNYPFEITKANALAQYQNASRLLRMVKIISILLFLYILYKTDQILLGEAESLGTSFMMIAVLSIILTIVLYLVKAYKSK